MSRTPETDLRDSDEPGEVHGDQVHLDEWAAPDVCDERGFLRPGKVLEWMDVVGALAASRYGRLPAVTVSVDGCRLRTPVLVGSRATMRARVVHTSRRSLGVALSMSASASGQRVAQPALGGYMTFVLLGDDGRPARVPAFKPQTPEDVALQHEGHLRRQFHDELSANRDALTDPGLHDGLADEVIRRDPLRHLLRELGGRLAGRRSMLGARSAQASYVHRIEPVRGGKLNFHGTLYGGTLMRWLETCAAMSAAAFVDAPVRLVAVHGLSFLRPVQPNVFVHMHAVVAHTDDDEVTVRIVARSEDPLTATSTENLAGFLSYAPLERRTAIPRVVRSDHAAADHFCEVALRKVLQVRIEALHRDRRPP